VSLYGSSNWYDDLAEYVTLYHLTEVLKQPYRVVIRKEGEEVFVYEPMKSDIVRGRFGQMKRFYEDERRDYFLSARHVCKMFNSSQGSEHDRQSFSSDPPLRLVVQVP
jgi:hypothetical protein